MSQLPSHYKTLTGRIIPATPVLHKMAGKMKLVPAAGPKIEDAAPDTPSTPSRGRKPASKVPLSKRVK